MSGGDSQTDKTSGNWQFNPNGTEAEPPLHLAGDQHSTAQHTPPPESVKWTASEFIAHEKGPKWYLILAGSVLPFTALVYWVTRDKITTGVIIAAAILFGLYGSHKPQTRNYSLDGSGLKADDKFYGYDQFRSFVVAHDGAFSSVSFMPLKRFMPILTVYYSPEDEAKIVQLLSARLPVEQHARDVIDRFLYRIRF